MAKQTFVTGNVLTAAQMNTLQANDYNATVSTKIASYVLVAADVGTTIVQNVATANTVTVNTALFAAGDTLRIQNIGAGVATVTAGTATVNTANSLALPQWGSGILYFTSASAAIFFPSAGAGAAGGGMILLSTTTLTGAAVTVSSISGIYRHLYVSITGATFSNAGNCTLKINAVSDSFWVAGVEADSITPVLRVAGGNTPLTIFKDTQTTGSHVMTFTIYDYADATYHTIQGQYTNVAASFKGGFYGGGWSPIAGGAAVTALVFTTTAGTFTAGTIKIYGVN